MGNTCAGRKIIQAGAIIVLLLGTAYASPASAASAESRPVAPDPLTPEARKIQEERIKQKALDDAYKAANKKIPVQKPADPWGNIRPNPPTSSNAQQGQK
jgi:hypothetical protein